jgi:TolB-like protein
MSIFDTGVFRAIDGVLTGLLWPAVLRLPQVSAVLMVTALVLVVGFVVKKTRLIALLLLVVLGVWFYYKTLPVTPAPSTSVQVEQGRPLPKAFPSELGEVQAELSSLMEEVGAYFSELGIKPDLAIYPFTISGGGNPPVLALLADDFAYYYSRDKTVNLVKRWLIEDAASDNGSIADAGRKQGANYVVAGKVIPLGNQIVVVSALIISVETTEITETYQRRIPRGAVEALLVEPPPPDPTEES